MFVALYDAWLRTYMTTWSFLCSIGCRVEHYKHCLSSLIMIYGAQQEAIGRMSVLRSWFANVFCSVQRLSTVSQALPNLVEFNRQNWPNSSCSADHRAVDISCRSVKQQHLQVQNIDTYRACKSSHNCHLGRRRSAILYSLLATIPVLHQLTSFSQYIQILLWVRADILGGIFPAKSCTADNACIAAGSFLVLIGWWPGRRHWLSNPLADHAGGLASCRFGVRVCLHVTPTTHGHSVVQQLACCRIQGCVANHQGWQNADCCCM